jgi:hypothetical protein
MFTHKTQIHPIHLAYLNFYTALSHDTLAREATLKNRYKELHLAEKHYMAALSALTPSTYDSPSFDTRASSPTSSTTSENIIWKFRRSASIDSTASYTSRADLDYSHRSHNYAFPSPPQATTYTHQRNKSSIIIPSRPSTPEEYQFASDTAAFVRMVRGHLQNVQDLKRQTGVPVVRFDVNENVVVKERVRSRVWEDDEGKERVRRERGARKWRKRFDPEETMRLCGEALAELEY